MLDHGRLVVGDSAAGRDALTAVVAEDMAGPLASDLADELSCVDSYLQTRTEQVNIAQVCDQIDSPLASITDPGGEFR